MPIRFFFRNIMIVRAALPRRPVRRRDVTSATMIGVLMSATLPARLGEPARAMSLARRIGRMRETFPVLLGTLVSQTMLNLLALVLLGPPLMRRNGNGRLARIGTALHAALVQVRALGLPALVREGLTWSDLRVQALSTTPVRLKPQPSPREPAAREGVRA